jgi:hypothetical protein
MEKASHQPLGEHQALRPLLNFNGVSKRFATAARSAIPITVGSIEVSYR